MRPLSRADTRTANPCPDDIFYRARTPERANPCPDVSLDEVNRYQDQGSGLGFYQTCAKNMGDLRHSQFVKARNVDSRAKSVL